MPRRPLHPGSPVPVEVVLSSESWRRHPQAQGLHAWWPTLKGVGSTIRGYGKNASDMTAYNGAALGADPLTGLAANNFDGATNSRYWSAPCVWSGGPVTVSFWLWSPTGTSDASAFGTNNSDDVSGQNRFQCHVPYAGSLYWDYGSGADARLQVSYGSAYTNRWTAITLQSAGADGAYMAVWLDGVLAGSRDASDSPSITTTTMDLGRFSSDYYGGFYAKGRIADFRIYNRVLSPAQVWALHAPQSRWSLSGSRSTRPVMGSIEPPASTIHQRRYPQILRVGSRSALAC